jgi:osmotically-inducible protein OsmY
MVADTATTGKVKLALANEPNLKDADISVKTDSGVVTLSGTAKSQDQVTTAQSVAQKQEGVNRVEVQIAVR